MRSDDIVTCYYCSGNHEASEVLVDRSEGVGGFMCFDCAVDQYPILFPNRIAVLSHALHLNPQWDDEIEPPAQPLTTADRQFLRLVWHYEDLVRYLRERGLDARWMDAYLANHGIVELTPRNVGEAMELLRAQLGELPRWWRW